MIGLRDALLHVDGQAGEPVEDAGDPDALALLLHTSGTTSKPKTVPIRQRNLVASTGAIARTYGLHRRRRDDVRHAAVPRARPGRHGAGHAVDRRHGVCCRGSGRRRSGPTSPRHGATWYTAVPTIHARLLTRARELPQAAKARPPVRPVLLCAAAHGPVAALRGHDRRPARRGLRHDRGGPSDGVEPAAAARSAGPARSGWRPASRSPPLDDDWRPVAAGEEGEVAVRGPSVVDQYLDNPAATAASFRDGWFRTGDVGKLSADGYLTLVGRLKELINRAGEKISPYEVEDVLLTHPAVAEAAAYPVPDEKYGEQVGVVVVLRGEATPRELTAHCAERLAAFKRPGAGDDPARDPEGTDRQDPAPQPGRAGGAVKVAVVGAGAIGAYVGAALHRGGAEVHLIARGEHLAAMRARRRHRAQPARRLSRASARHGRPGRDRAGRHRVPRPEGVQLRRRGPAAHAAAADRAPASSPRRTASRGGTSTGCPARYEGRRVEAVDPDGAVSAVIPPQPAIGCVVYCSTEIESPGVIRHVEGTRFSIGEPDGTISARCTAFSEAMIAGGLKCPVEKDLRSDIWLKLLGNVAFNPISVLTRATMGEIAAHPGTRELVLAMMHETAEIAARLGSPPKISVERRFDGAARVGDHKTSMLMDFEAGKPLETDVLLKAPSNWPASSACRRPNLEMVHALIDLLTRQGTVGFTAAVNSRLRPGSDQGVAAKFDVLRGHCEAENRAFDEVEKTVCVVRPALADVDAFVADVEEYAKLGVTEVMVMPDRHPVEFASQLAERVVPRVLPIG